MEYPSFNDSPKQAQAMPAIRNPFALLAAAVLLATSPLATCQLALAGGSLETSDFADVSTAVETAIAEYGAENVLLVCDIDNTLLAMNQDLGSDQWFEWQSYLLANKPESPALVAKSFGDLLQVQGTLFTLGKMHPPQADLPARISALQETGVRTLVLTSRGDEYRKATIRELSANGYDFAKSCMTVQNVPCGVYKPYDLEAIEQSGLTAEEAELFRLSKPRGVSFGDGVFMTAGQHKGAMLITMLARCPHTFKAVIFVDDHGRHVLRVYDALTRRGLDVTCLHYQREDDNVKRFRYCDKVEVTARWQRLQETLDAVFE